jgi:hypothetical protein
VLLQKISNILTAPPRDSEKEYAEMKKLMQSVDYVEEWNKKLRTKRNKVFFQRIKHTGPYYNPHEWETDYQKQVQIIPFSVSDSVSPHRPFTNSSSVGRTEIHEASEVHTTKGLG